MRGSCYVSPRLSLHNERDGGARKPILLCYTFMTAISISYRNDIGSSKLRSLSKIEAASRFGVGHILRRGAGIEMLAPHTCWIVAVVTGIHPFGNRPSIKLQRHYGSAILFFGISENAVAIFVG